jgi:hypothetical protein
MTQFAKLNVRALQLNRLLFDWQELWIKVNPATESWMSISFHFIPETSEVLALHHEKRHQYYDTCIPAQFDKSLYCAIPSDDVRCQTDVIPLQADLDTIWSWLIAGRIYDFFWSWKVEFSVLKWQSRVTYPASGMKRTLAYLKE